MRPQQSARWRISARNHDEVWLIERPASPVRLAGLPPATHNEPWTQASVAGGWVVSDLLDRCRSRNSRNL